MIFFRFPLLHFLYYVSLFSVNPHSTYDNYRWAIFCQTKWIFTSEILIYFAMLEYNKAKTKNFGKNSAKKRNKFFFYFSRCEHLEFIKNQIRFINWNSFNFCQSLANLAGPNQIIKAELKSRAFKFILNLKKNLKKNLTTITLTLSYHKNLDP